jgi:hypothetical protein
MAFNKIPQAWIAGIDVVTATVSGSPTTGLFIPLSSLPKLQASEVSAATGDIRKVYFAITEALHAAFMAKPPEDWPRKMGVGKEFDERRTQGSGERDIVRMRTIFDFYVEDLTTDVLAEPPTTGPQEVAPEP